MAAEDKKKHHFVPQFVLRYFADASGLLEVCRLNESRSYRSTPADLGHRNHGHTIRVPGRAPNPNLFERQMGDIEAATAVVVRRLVEGTASEIEPHDKQTLAWFLSLQWHRHRHLLGSVVQYLAAHEKDPLDEDAQVMTSAALSAAVVPLLSAWQMRNDPTARPKERWDGVVASLLGMHWSLLRYRSPSLVVSDNLVCLSGVAEGHSHLAPTPAWLAHGVGVGFDNCARVTVPVTPTIGLLLTRTPPQRKLKCTEFNRFTVFNSREFLAYSPAWPAARPSVYEAFRSDLERQRFLRPTLGPYFR